MGLATVQGQLISKGALKFKIADSSFECNCKKKKKSAKKAKYEITKQSYRECMQPLQRKIN